MSILLKQLQDSFPVLYLVQCGKRAELASAEAFSPGEAQRIIDQLEDPVRGQMNQSRLSWGEIKYFIKETIEASIGYLTLILSLIE